MRRKHWKKKHMVVKQTLVLGGLLSSGLYGLEGTAKRGRVGIDLLLVDLYLSFARQSQRLHLRPYWLLRSLRLHFSHGHERARAVRDRDRERERERVSVCFVLKWNFLLLARHFCFQFSLWMGMGSGRVDQDKKGLNPRFFIQVSDILPIELTKYR